MKLRIIFYFFITFLLFKSSTNCFGQSIQFYKTLFENGSIEEKVKSMIGLQEYYSSENIDSLKYFAEKLVIAGLTEKYYPAVEFGNWILCDYLISKGKFTQSIEIIHNLIPNASERKDNLMLSNFFRSLCYAYREQRDAKSALYWSKKALNIDLSNYNEKEKLSGILSYADALRISKRNDEAIVQINKYIRLAGKIKYYRGLAAAEALLGDVYKVSGKQEKAFLHFNKSSVYANKTNFLSSKSYCINNIAIMEFESGNVTNAKIHFEEALALRIKTGNMRPISESYYNLGDYYFYTEDNEKAIEYYKKSAEVCVQNNLYNEYVDALKSLVNVYRKTGQFERATLLIEESIVAQQSINANNAKDDKEIDVLSNQLIKWEQNQKEITKENISTSLWFKINCLLGGIIVLLILFILYKKSRSNSTSQESLK